MEQLPYEDEQFDTVISTMALSGYPNGGRAMSEIRRVLRSAGRLILIDVNYPADHNRLGMRLTSFWRHLVDIIRDVGKLLEDHGFDYEDREIGRFGSVHMYLCDTTFGETKHRAQVELSRSDGDHVVPSSIFTFDFVRPSLHLVS